MKKYDGIIFDLDGTLYDKNRLPLFLILFNLRTFGYLISARKALKKLEGSFFNSEKEFRNEYYGKIALKKRVQIEKVIKWENEVFYVEFIKILKRYKSRSGLKQLLTELELPCAVLSDYDYVDERLISLNIDPNLFNVRLYSGSLGGLKPAGELFLKTAQKLGINPQNVLVVGDSKHKDGKGAKRAGMDYYHVTNETWPLLNNKLQGIQ